MGLVATTFIAGLVASPVDPEAGFLCAVVSLGLMSVRGGTMHGVLQSATGPTTLLLISLEQMVLFGGLYVLWRAVTRRHPVVEGDDPIADAHHTPTVPLLACATQGIVMAVILWALEQSDAKKQSIAAMLIAACTGAIVARRVFPTRTTLPCLVAPGAVGLIGYLGACSMNEGWQTGFLHGPLAVLARPVPLDYASVGVAGAIFGFWTSRRGQFAEQAIE